MKSLLLIRHAKSSWDYPQLSDIDRPLSTRGRTDAKEMGVYLLENYSPIDILMSSPAKRAYTTAAIISDQLNYQDEIMVDKALYTFTDSDIYLKIARDTDPSANSIAMFSHNYALYDAVDSLSYESLTKFPTCAVCYIQFDTDQWNNIEASNIKKIEIITPKSLKKKK